jgi:hypothetical protein
LGNNSQFLQQNRFISTPDLEDYFRHKHLFFRFRHNKYILIENKLLILHKIINVIRMDTTVKLYSLSYKESKTYLFSLIFIAGNIVLPQICHFVPGGGLMWLPIYFFTLIAAYKYGIGVGLLTAIASPLINSLLFGMPPVAVLPVIIIKSVLLAVGAAYAAHLSGKISFLAIAAAVVAYQLVGTLIEWAIVANFFRAVNDLRVGYPGILIQIFAGYAVLKAINKI